MTAPSADRPPPGARWIALMSGLVPRGRRDAWRREWDAELVFAWRRMDEAGRASPLNRMRLRWRVLACTFDALDERRQTMTTTSGWWNDVRFAARSLARAPGFTAVALVTIALGIGANTAVFSLVDGVLLRPLPFRQADELLDVGHAVGEGGDRMGTPEALYLAYAEHARTLERVALHRVTAANLVSGGEPERVVGAVVTPGFFEVLGTTPALGRTFTDDEGLPGGDPVVVLGDALWQRSFGADPQVVGSTVLLDGESRRVVGVMAPGFAWPERDTRFWVPMTIDRTEPVVGNFAPRAVARLAPGASLDEARTEAAALMARLPELRDGTAFLLDAGLAADVITLKESVVGDVRLTLWILVGTVAFVMLIACANVANLLLVRTEGRSRELAVRVALGAGRFQIGRAFFMESALLSFGGACLGLLVAQAAVRWSVRMAPAGLPRITEIGVDQRAVAVALALAGAVAIVFGLFPVLRYGASKTAARLRSGGARGGTGGGRDRQRLRSALVVAQVSLALVLLVGAGLMVRSVLALRSVEPGFESGGVVAVRLTVPAGEIPDARETAELQRALVERTAALPGVRASGAVSQLPLQGGSYFSVELEDHPRGESDVPIMAHGRWASPGYFETLGISLVEGRALEPGDDAMGLRGVVVSRAFAERWWPGASALGRRVRSGFDGDEWWQIVGVTDHVHLQTLETAPEEAIYFPMLFGTLDVPRVTRSFELVLRAAGDPLAVVPRLRDEIRALHPRIPLADVRTMDQVLGQSTARASFTTSVLAAAAAVALLLGVVGIYGVVSYVVSQRTREIGVRMALGAEAGAVRRMVVRQGLALAAVGVAIGLVGSFALSSFLAALLFGVAATDPVTYAAVTVTLVGVTWLACWVPAARAARIQPSQALEAE